MVTRASLYALVGLMGAALVTTTPALAGSGVAAVFNLGQANTVNQKSTLTGATTDAELVVQNTGAGTALSLIGANGAPAFKVNSDTKIANLNADKLDGIDSASLQKRVSGTCGAGQAIKVVKADGSVACEPVGSGAAWGLKGNSGTNPTTSFLGTTDDVPLSFRVNGSVALRLVPGTFSANVTGGSPGNNVAPGSEGATVFGGNGSASNEVISSFGSVLGGAGNQAGEAATVLGGLDNRATGPGSLAGGQNAEATGTLAVAWGLSTHADGLVSLALGQRATALEDGSFVWNGSTHSVTSFGGDTFTAASTGGARFISGFAANGLPSAGVELKSGNSSWSSLSDRASKRGFTRISPRKVLNRLDRIPITRWSYKSQPLSVRHMGPMAQDFRKAFGLGEDNKHIDTIDADGVALAAIQGLYRQNQELRRQNDELSTRLTRLERTVRGVSRRGNRE